MKPMTKRSQICRSVAVRVPEPASSHEPSPSAAVYRGAANLGTANCVLIAVLIMLTRFTAICNFVYRCRVSPREIQILSWLSELSLLRPWGLSASLATPFRRDPCFYLGSPGFILCFARLAGGAVAVPSGGLRRGDIRQLCPPRCRFREQEPRI